MHKFGFILFCTLFLFACSSPYHEHFFRENPEFSTQKSTISWEIFYSSGKLISLPNSHAQWDIINAINAAQKRIWIEIYTWTDAAKLTDTVLAAKKRWVDVRVVLEGNVFWTPKINASLFQKLKSAQIPVVYADNHRYTFTHAKFWIIDDLYFISTGNWTASFFTKNREYIYQDSDTYTRSFLEMIFLSDSDHLGFKDISKIPSHIVMSPLDSREKLTEFISSAKKNIILYVQTLDDPELLSHIEILHSQWVHVQICTADNESNLQRQKEFSYLSWKLIRKPYLHAKIIIVDDVTMFIGSHNLTTNAIENNREIGIFLKNRTDLIKNVMWDFKWDDCS